MKIISDSNENWFMRTNPGLHASSTRSILHGTANHVQYIQPSATTDIYTVTLNLFLLFVLASEHGEHSVGDCEASADVDYTSEDCGECTKRFRGNRVGVDL